MARHKKYDLLDIIVQSIFECGWNVIYLSDLSEHPFLLKVYNQEESYKVRVYIWNLTHGGGKARPKNEYRIQITGIEKFRNLEGEKTLILGWWGQIGVFAGFDFFKHNGKLGASPSIQIREENLRSALDSGFSACDRGNGEIAIAFRPDFFVEYVRNLENLHLIGESPDELMLAEKVVNSGLLPNDQDVELAAFNRTTVVKQVVKKLREMSFKRRVLKAYDFSCAFTGLQLKLIDAAHIIPVKEDYSSDFTANGIALSPTYHRAYDKGIVTMNEDYKIMVNKEKIKELKEMDQIGGVDLFIKNLRPEIIIPQNLSDRPNTNFIKEANKLRGWKL
jgi:putative restriction endonuclease